MTFQIEPHVSTPEYSLHFSGLSVNISDIMKSYILVPRTIHSSFPWPVFNYWKAANLVDMSLWFYDCLENSLQWQRTLTPWLLRTWSSLWSLEYVFRCYCAQGSGQLNCKHTACIKIWMTKDQALALTIILYFKNINKK